MVLYERPLDLPRERKRSDLSVELGRLSAEEIEAYAAFHPDLFVDEVRSRFRDGDACCVARSEGEIVASRWFSTRRAVIPFLEHSFPLGDREGYLYNAYTAPAWRGRGLAGTLTAFMLDELEKEGAVRALSAARPQNIAGSGFNRSLGEPVGLLATVRFWRWRRHLRLPAPPWWRD